MGFLATSEVLAAFFTNLFGCTVRFIAPIQSLAGFGGFTVKINRYWRRRSSETYGHGWHPYEINQLFNVVAVDARHYVSQRKCPNN